MIESGEIDALLAGGYGWRARIGFLSPGAVDESLSRQFYRMAPAGVTMVRTSLGVTKLTEDEVESSIDRAAAAATLLKRAAPGCIVLGGSPTVVTGGFGSDETLAKRITEVAGIQTTTAQTAAVEAMRKLGMKRIALATPFPDVFNVKLRAFLTASGFEVASLQHLTGDYRDLTMTPLRAGYELGRAAFKEAGDADGLYFPGAPFPIVDVIDVLEHELNTTVVSSMQCTLWKGMQMCGVKDLPVAGYGRLLRNG